MIVKLRGWRNGSKWLCRCLFHFEFLSGFDFRTRDLVLFLELLYCGVVALSDVGECVTFLDRCRGVFLGFLCSLGICRLAVASLTIAALAVAAIVVALISPAVARTARVAACLRSALAVAGGRCLLSVCTAGATACGARCLCFVHFHFGTLRQEFIRAVVVDTIALVDKPFCGVLR